MLRSEITMFQYEETSLFGRLLDIDGINEEFENSDNDYINKIVRDLEENKLNY